MGVLMLKKSNTSAPALPGKRPYNKYRVAPKAMRTVDGIVFDSKKEATRYGQLKLLQGLGEIAELRRQVDYPLVWNGIRITIYRADFVYIDIATGTEVVEDVKGLRTREYIMKRRMMKACHGIEVYET